MAGALTDDRPPTAPPPDAPTTDRRVKIALLVGSGVTLVFLIAAMVRENFLSEWRHHQRRYRQLLLDSSDERQRRLGENFSVEMRQIDLPQFGTRDRCVSCHLGIDNPAMATAPQPHRTHPGDFLKHHPVEKYGCTICHQGQGGATNFHEAKATDVHWDYPLLPARLTAASCGTCHAADSPLMARHAPALAQGRQLFLDRGCQSCHKLGGIGGQLGPALDGEGDKIKHQLPMAHIKGDHTLANWLEQHFDRPQVLVPGSQMRPPRLTPSENEALTIYMLSLRKRDLPRTYVPADRIAALDTEIHHKVTDPVVLYNRLCVSCHGDGSFGTWDKFFGRFMPAVRGPGLRAVADKDYLRAAIEQGRPGTLMPAWGKSAGGLTKEQVDVLVEYLARGDNHPLQKLRPWPSPGGGNSVRGGELFTQLCAGCHGPNRLAPSLSNSVFQRTASDEFLVRTIVNGRADTAMPAFQRADADGLT
ncbi:MAG TPA: c-type cytochrome, partial [Gemmataceae bacterium]|nr:c-type cytochrome [Gemmataceae bacterium]